MGIEMAGNPWLPRRRLISVREVVVFCFPYAGGSASIYREWVAAEPRDVSFLPVELPGRSTRMKEAPVNDMDRLVQDFVGACKSELELFDYALFGHSMGALICIKLLDGLKKCSLPLPQHLFVSGLVPPEARAVEPLHKLSDEDLIQELRKMNGTPEEILSNPELIQLFLPALRSDFALLASCSPRPLNAITVPMTVFGGTHDRLAPPSEMSAWSNLATQGVRHVQFVGDHFFIHAHARDIRREIKVSLAASSGAGRS
ncbi:thioesterase II family protein [Bradyrhizobium sp. SZCCHNR2035]|uniref:thioesterase II family protein n=1 Tax=Bradyrhizobium sp. SZCCHNR2035 TaxID=3057386 RepID=UPI002915C947|nr:alpha/beta fold hydrolase [Bradyrhizobium sp. SZCCHNR2035]